MGQCWHAGPGNPYRSTPVLTYALFKLFLGMNTFLSQCSRYILVDSILRWQDWQFWRVIKGLEGSWDCKMFNWAQESLKKDYSSLKITGRWIEAQPKTGMEQEYLWDVMVFGTEYDLAVLCYWSDWYVLVHSTEEYLCRISSRVKRHA